MAEDVKGKGTVEKIAELAETWYKGEFDLAYYNFYICTTTEGIIQRCKEGRNGKTHFRIVDATTGKLQESVL